MASPIGHAIAGVGVAGAVAGGLGADTTPRLWVGAAAASYLPDLDLLPSFWGVSFRRTHRQASHSILVLAPLAVLSWVVAYAFDPPLDWRPLAAWAAALISHLVLDILCTGLVLGRQEHGIPLFWPLTCRRWFVPKPMFPEVDLLDDITPGLIVRACLRELVHLGARLAHCLSWGTSCSPNAPSLLKPVFH